MEHSDAHTLLLICADEERGRYLADQFTADGFDVVEADHAAMAERALARSYPDVVVVDSHLPDAPGLRVVAAVRQQARPARVDPLTPMLMVCARDDALERVRALERGADDVVAASVDYAELRARVRALLRRADGRQQMSVIRVGELEIDPISRRVHLGGELVELSQKEYLLLQVLASEPMRVFSKDELLRAIWGYRATGRTRTLDSHACRLRQKLQAEGPRLVVNVWGVGYRLLDAPLGVAPAPTPESRLAVAA